LGVRRGPKGCSWGNQGEKNLALGTGRGNIKGGSQKNFLGKGWDYLLIFKEEGVCGRGVGPKELALLII